MLEFEDKDLGKIIVKPNKRAKHVIARRKNGFVQITVPYGFTMKNLPPILNELKPRLMQVKLAVPRMISEEMVIESFSFRASFVRSPSVDSIRLSLKNGQLLIFVPNHVIFSDPEFQQRVKESIVNVLRLEAKRILPEKTAYFAKIHGLSFQSVKINKSKTRWGSCSRQKNINFSLFLLLMPEKFIDYVVLHELAHTVELNHSEKFWKLLSAICGEDAKALSKTLKKHQSESYALLAD